MKGFLLLVTWFVPGMPPSSYQTNFETEQNCQVARDAVHAEERRILLSYMQRADAATGGQGQPASMLALSLAPTITSVCVPQ